MRLVRRLSQQMLLLKSDLLMEPLFDRICFSGSLLKAVL